MHYSLLRPISLPWDLLHPIVNKLEVKVRCNLEVNLRISGEKDDYVFWVVVLSAAAARKRHPLR